MQPRIWLAFWAASPHFWACSAFYAPVPTNPSLLQIPSSPRLYCHRGLLLKPVKVPLDEHFLDNVGVNKALVLNLFLLQWGFRPHQLKRRDAPQSQLCKPVLGHIVPSPASQSLSGTQPSAAALHRAGQAPGGKQRQLCLLTHQQWVPLVASPAGLAAAAPQDWLQWPPHGDELGCPARHCRRGDKWLGEVMPAGRWRGLWDPTPLQEGQTGTVTQQGQPLLLLALSWPGVVERCPEPKPALPCSVSSLSAEATSHRWQHVAGNASAPLGLKLTSH